MDWAGFEGLLNIADKFRYRGAKARRAKQKSETIDVKRLLSHDRWWIPATSYNDVQRQIQRRNSRKPV